MASEDLTIVLERNAEGAAYEQIAAQIRDAIVAGTLEPGAVLPGVRGLASDLGINFNTVARAYRLLEEQGFVRIRDRSGVEVVRPASRPSPVQSAPLERELWQVLTRLRQAGVTIPDLRRLVDSQLGALDGGSRPGVKSS